jgi:hypothetical protein
MRARRSIAILSGATLAITLAMAGGGALSTANAGGPTWLSAGTLTLSTSSSGTAASGFEGWTFSDGAAAPVTQALTTPTGSCLLTPADGPLVKLSAANGFPGFAAHSIGVTQTATSAQCNKVNINKTTTKTSKTTSVTTTSIESLTVALNNVAPGALYDPTFAGLMAASTHLDLEVRDDSTLTAQLFDHGVPLPAANGLFTLIGDEKAPPATLPANTTYCRTGTTEGGSDEIGTRDNCPWDLTPGLNFDSIVLTPVAGSFSLEGGGDYGTAAPANRTTFALVKQYDGTLATCDGTSSATSFGGDATLFRLANGDPNQACAPLPYTFSTAGGYTTFHKPQPAGDTSQFAITLTRHFSPAPLGVPAPKVNWEDGSNTDLPIPWCAGGVIGGIDSTNLPTGIAFPLSAALDQSPDATGKAGVQYACVYKQSPVLNLGDGSLTVVDYVFFTGDIKFPTA